MILSREQILNSDDLPTKEVDAHEWGKPGDTVLVRALSLKEANDWRRGMLVQKPKANSKTHGIDWEYEYNEQATERSTLVMLTLACIDEHRKQIFTSVDIEALSQKSSAPIARIVKVVKEISGLAVESAEEAEKNSDPSLSDSPSSD